MDENTSLLSTNGNLFKYIFKSPYKDSEFKLYHKVTFDLVKVYDLTLAVHPAVEEARVCACPAHLCMW